MAIARLIAPFAQVSGRLNAPESQANTGAVVAMPDRFGRTLLRGFVVPENPQTAAQEQIRGIFTTVSEGYQSLSQSQVEQWQQLANTINRSGRLGVDYRLSWTSLFSQVNSYRLQNGLTVSATLPSTTSLPPLTFTSIVSDDGNPSQVVSVTHSAVPASGGFVAFRITRDLASLSRSARRNELRYPAEPADCIVPLTIASTGFQITATRLNVLSGSNVGAEMLILNADYVPVARTFRQNISVGTA